MSCSWRPGLLQQDLTFLCVTANSLLQRRPQWGSAGRGGAAAAAAAAAAGGPGTSRRDAPVCEPGPAGAAAPFQRTNGLGGKGWPDKVTQGLRRRDQGSDPESPSNRKWLPTAPKETDLAINWG